MHEPNTPQDGLTLKVEACGLTDTDLKVLRGEISAETEYLGGQIVGTVKEVGENTTGYEVGERIMVSCFVPCGNCRPCRLGKTNECLHRKAHGFQMIGGLAGEISLDKHELDRGCVVKLPNNLKFEEACAADVAAAVYCSQRRCGIGPGMKILVLGCGPSGCMHTHIAKFRGGDVLIQSDVVASRMEMARPFMADYLVDSKKENLNEIVKSVTEGLGADVVIVAADNPQAFEEAVDNVAVGGKILLYSRFGENAGKTPVDLAKLQNKQVTLVSSDGYTQEDIQEIVWLAGKRKITLKWLVTSVIDSSEIEKKMEALENGKELRVVVHP